MIGPRQHLENLAHHSLLPLGRLIRIGVGANGYWFGLIALRQQFALEECRGIRLGKNLGFEIKTGGEPEKGVSRAGVAIDAAMLAAAIGVDRAVERNIW